MLTPMSVGRAIGMRQPEAAGCELLSGGYLTDGRTLFRIEHVHSDPRSGEAFVELENCTTLELSVWPVEHICSRPVRCVIPGRAPEFDNAASHEDRHPARSSHGRRVRPR